MRTDKQILKILLANWAIVAGKVGICNKLRRLYFIGIIKYGEYLDTKDYVLSNRDLAVSLFQASRFNGYFWNTNDQLIRKAFLEYLTREDVGFFKRLFNKLFKTQRK